MSAAKEAAAESPETRAAAEMGSPETKAAAEMDLETGRVPEEIMGETAETETLLEIQEVPAEREVPGVPAAPRAAAPQAALQVDRAVPGAPAAVPEDLQAAAPQEVQEARAAVPDHPEAAAAVRDPEEPIRRGQTLRGSGRSRARSIILQDRTAMAFSAEERETASAEAEKRWYIRRRIFP